MNTLEIFTNYGFSSNLDIDILIPVVTLPVLDILLCYMFSKKARWFQLHTVTNFIITMIIFKDVKKYYLNLFDAIEEKTSNIDNYFIVILHLYHCLCFKNLSMLDYFHHLLFIITGVLPCTFLFKTNISIFLTFTGCGFPGIIEYGSLTLMKHNIITPLFQKKINSIMYAYLRCPLSIFNITFMYIAYVNGYLNDENPVLILYIMFLTYFNGTFYNKLTIENYINSYYKNILHR